MRESVSVYSLWRDSEPHIYKTLSQLEDLEKLNYDFEYFFYENDSKDNTVKILSEWLSTRKGSFEHKDLKIKKFISNPDIDRMEFLAQCRNKCKNLGKNSTSKYCLLIDSDIEFNNENLIKQINLLNELEDAVAITPNVRQINVQDLVYKTSPDIFYDVHALRDVDKQKGISFTDCPFIKSKDRLDWILKKPIKCASSFGGFFILLNDHFQQTEWSTNGDCEHILFCEKLLKFGYIYIDPNSKVYTEPDLSNITIEDLQGKATKQLNYLEFRKTKTFDFKKI
jgi:glycosyltransferase involved in cell wall biosynthesis